MTKNASRPGPLATVSGLGIRNGSAAFPDLASTAPSAFHQPEFAVLWIAARSRVNIETARVLAELANIGGWQ
jgi:hypothetical protein